LDGSAAVDDFVPDSLAPPLARGACSTGTAGCRAPLPAGFFGIDWDENLRETARLLCLHEELLRKPHELRGACISVYEEKATGGLRCLYAYHVVLHIQFRGRAHHRSGCLAAHDIGGKLNIGTSVKPKIYCNLYLYWKKGCFTS
jgi:hypothetical protein